MATVNGTPARRTPRDERVYHPLDQLRGVIRRYVVYEGLLSVVIFLAAWFALALVLDYGVFKAFTWDWVQEGGRWVRAAALVAALVLLAGIVVFRIVRRLNTEFSYPSLALVLERRFPAVLGDRLITAVELADVERAARHGYSPEMIRATIAEARERVAKLEHRVHEVFNWRRLRVMGLVAGGIVLFTLVAALASHAVATRSFSPVRAGWKFYHTTAILAERDLLLMNTPWPRRALVRFEAVPESGLRVPQNKPVAAVRVRAYQWVVADRREPEGWRPLVWSDVTPELVGLPVPILPLGELGLANEKAAPPTDPAAWAVDAVWERARENPAVRARLGEAMGPDDYLALQRVFDRLQELADDPAMARTLRFLDPPATVSFRYAGQRTAGTGPLAPEGAGLFAGTIGGTDEKTKLKEDVLFLVSAEDYRTPARAITLVPAPVLTRLTAAGFEPAYLHYASPLVPDPADPSKYVIGGYAELRGLRQRMPDEKVPLVGDSSVVVVPVGTELVLTGTTELPVVAAEVIPDTGTIPGARPGSQEPVPLEVRDGHTFELAFRGEDRVRSQVRFRLRLANADRITTERTVLIQVRNDTEPVVEVAPDLVRKAKGENLYYVTPRARIPFNPESYIRDDNGLSKVAYTATYWADDANAAQAVRAGLLARDLVVPVTAGDPDAVARILAGYVAAVRADTANARRSGSFPLGQFVAADSRLRRETRDRVLALLAEPLAADRPVLVKQLKMKAEVVPVEEFGEPFTIKVRLPDGTEGERQFRYLTKITREVRGDYFDVSALGLDAESDDVRPDYWLELNVQATDTNFDTGPGVTANRDPLRFRVVSPATLLVMIGQDQIDQGAKLDEALKKLAEARQKYEFVNSRNGFLPPDQMNTVQVRSKDAAQDLIKAREAVQVAARGFRRIERECVLNQLDDKNVTENGKLANRLARLLGESPPATDPAESRQAVDEEIRIALGQQEARPTFPQAEELVTAGQAALDQGRWADPVTVTNALIEINRVERELTEIRKSLGGTMSKEYLQEMARALLQRQEAVGARIRRASTDAQARATLPTPEIMPIGQVFLAKGEMKKFKHAINWRQYKEDELVVKVEASDRAALTVPPELTLDFEKNDQSFEYEVRAANKEGDFVITLTPASGDKVEVKVTVR